MRTGCLNGLHWPFGDALPGSVTPQGSRLVPGHGELHGGTGTWAPQIPALEYTHTVYSAPFLSFTPKSVKHQVEDLCPYFSPPSSTS